jgi:hypothetical protein
LLTKHMKNGSQSEWIRTGRCDNRQGPFATRTSSRGNMAVSQN